MHHNVDDVLFRDQLIVLSLLVHTMCALDLLEHILMPQFLHDGHFLFDCLTSHLVETFLEDLDGDLSMRLALPKLDFAGATGAERVVDGVLTNLLLFTQIIHVYVIDVLMYNYYS